ncbi:MAG: hypothetical protein KC620_14175 [Myxococcales bacterium]|nr:hypothetical protein [Myxococcales bacterium]
MRLAAALFGLVLLLACPAAATPTEPTTPEQDLRDAENSYYYGDYPRVMAKLAPLVEPDILLADPAAVARAYELLGLAAFFLDQQADARTWFERLIRYRPDAALNPVVVPPPAVAFFDDIKAGLSDEISRKREALRREQEAEEARRRQATQTQVKVETQVNSRLVAGLPFGIGQFQNGDDALGYTFLSTEVVAIGLSGFFFLAVEDLRQTDGRFARSDVARAENYQTAQLISGGIALGLMVTGIAHALLTYEPERPLRETPMPAPDSAAPPVGQTLFTF